MLGPLALALYAIFVMVGCPMPLVTFTQSGLVSALLKPDQAVRTWSVITLIDKLASVPTLTAFGRANLWGMAAMLGVTMLIIPLLHCTGLALLWCVPLSRGQHTMLRRWLHELGRWCCM